MMIVDSHLDLAMNAVYLNRDLRMPAHELRRVERAAGRSHSRNGRSAKITLTRSITVWGGYWVVWFPFAPTISEACIRSDEAANSLASGRGGSAPPSSRGFDRLK